MKYSTPCTPQLPCRQFRVCDYCAKLRQARIAEIARSRCAADGATYAVIAGLSPANIPAVRSLRLGAGGMWTVEVGEKMGGLHMNLLFDGLQEITAADLAATLPIDHASTWTKPVALGDVRHVAAYISKRAGMPTRMEYDGRLYGTYGTWRSAAEVARQRDAAPTVAAAALELELRAWNLAPAPAPQTSHDRDHYRDIARRHLPALYAILAGKPVDK